MQQFGETQRGLKPATSHSTATVGAKPFEHTQSTGNGCGTSGNYRIQFSEPSKTVSGQAVCHLNPLTTAPTSPAAPSEQHFGGSASVLHRASKEFNPPRLTPIPMWLRKEHLSGW